MSHKSAQSLLIAAAKAHRQGFIDAATAVFQQIVTLHPTSVEASDAAFYLEHGRLPLPFGGELIVDDVSSNPAIDAPVEQPRRPADRDRQRPRRS
jgi:hypothetical protein